MQTPAQADVLAQLEALTAVVEGWVDHVVDGIGRRLLGSYSPLQEAVRRRRAEATWGDRYVARLLGMGLRQSAYERDRRFIAGVLERAGEDAFGRLWASPRELPPRPRSMRRDFGWRASNSPLSNERRGSTTAVGHGARYAMSLTLRSRPANQAVGCSMPPTRDCR